MIVDPARVMTSSSINETNWASIQDGLLGSMINASERGEPVLNLLDFVLDKVEEAVHFTWAAIWLFNEEAEEWYIALSRGLSRDAADIRFPRNSALPCQVGERGTPMLVEDLESESFHRFTKEHHAMRSAMYAPMRIAGRPLGVIAVYGDRKAAFSQDDLSFLTSIGNDLRIAIAFAALDEQRERLLILKERDRLAGDLHDGILQVLSSIHLLVAEARRRMEDGLRVGAIEILGHVDSNLNEALDEVRSAVARLRHAGTFEDVAEVASRSKRRLESAGIRTDLCLDQSNPPEPVSDTLASICREGCNNILRHSDAEHAWIRLRRVGSHIELLITDDGLGPSLCFAGDSETHLGIQMMKERAARLGGSLSFGTSEQGGFALECRIPIECITK